MAGFSETADILDAEVAANIKSKTLTTTEIPGYVKQLDCSTLHKLARLLEIPRRSKLRKSQLVDRLVKRLKEPDVRDISWGTGVKMGPLLLACPGLCTSNNESTWKTIFKDQINAAFAEDQKRYKAVYASSSFKKCDMTNSITLINKDDDIYFFVLNGLAKIIVLPLETVVYDKKDKEGVAKAVNTTTKVMSQVWNSALNWLHPGESLVNPLDVFLDNSNSELQLEFKERKLGESAKIITLTVAPQYDLSYLVARLRNRLKKSAPPPPLFADHARYLEEELKKHYPTLTVDDDLNIYLEGYTMRFRGTFSAVVGWVGSPEIWSEPSQDSLAIGYETPKVVGEVSSSIPPKASGRHLTFAILEDHEFGFEAQIVPGFFTTQGSATKRPEKINTSAMTLGLDWFDSDFITVGNPFTMPRAVSAALHSRPVYGGGDNDCPAGYDRPNHDACCTYILKNVLDTLNVEQLEDCLVNGTECKSMDPEDLKQLKLFVTGEKRASDALNEFVSSLGLTPKQLAWTMQFATSIKQKWVHLLGKALNRMYEDSGISTDADRCNAETNALVDFEDAKLSSSGTPQGSWGWVRLVAKAAGIVLWGVTKSLRILWVVVSWLAEQAGMVFAASMSVGQRLATWILNDPSKARFILVLVRRVRVSQCQRFGAYLITNGYIDISNLNEEESRKLQAKLVELNGSVEAEAGVDDKSVGEDVVTSRSWFDALKSVSGRVAETAKQVATTAQGIGQDVSSLAAGGMATITEKVFTGEAVQGMLARSGTMLKKAVVSQVKQLPFVGAFVGEVVDFIAEEAGGQANQAVKDALVINKLDADITATIDLLGDIFNVNACLLDAGFHPTVQINWTTFTDVVASIFTETQFGRAATILAKPITLGGRAVWWTAGVIGGTNEEQLAKQQLIATQMVEKAYQTKIEALWAKYFRNRYTLGQGTAGAEAEIKNKKEVLQQISVLEAEQLKRNKAGQGHIFWPAIAETAEESAVRTLFLQKDPKEVSIHAQAIDAEKQRKKVIT